MDIDRRRFLAALAGLPLLGRLKPLAAKPVLVIENHRARVISKLMRLDGETQIYRGHFIRLNHGGDFFHQGDLFFWTYFRPHSWIHHMPVYETSNMRACLQVVLDEIDAGKVVHERFGTPRDHWMHHRPLPRETSFSARTNETSS